MKVTLATENGSRFFLRIYWGEGCKPYGCHNATKHLGDTDIVNDNDSFGKPEDYKPEDWAKVCDHCGEPVPETLEFWHQKQVRSKRLYDTPSRLLEAGNLHYVSYYPDNMFWDNHTGPHLICTLPNGNEWNIDSRASNCSLPEDRLHRCWVRHGEVPNIHVDKEGLTCTAGAGSILSGDFHGFLHNGELTNC